MRSTRTKPRRNVFGFLDETGLLHGPATDRFFGLGLLVVHQPAALHRAIVRYKNRAEFFGEFKFSHTSHQNVQLYKGFVDQFFDAADVRFSCVIYDKNMLDIGTHYANQFNRAYNSFAARLIAKSIHRSREYIALIADDVSTSKDDNYEKEIRERVRRRLRRSAMFGTFRTESHAVSELQLCDVLLGAVAFSFKVRHRLTRPGPRHRARLQLVQHIQARLGIQKLSGQCNRRLKSGRCFTVDEFFQQK